MQVRVELIDGGEDGDEVSESFLVAIRPFESVGVAIRRYRPLRNYDFFYSGLLIKETDTPTSLSLTNGSKIDAYKLATEEEMKDLKNHLIQQKMDPTKFKYYSKGNMGVADLSNPTSSTFVPPQPAGRPPSETKHKWGRGRKLGIR